MHVIQYGLQQVVRPACSLGVVLGIGPSIEVVHQYVDFRTQLYGIELNAALPINCPQPCSSYEWSKVFTTVLSNSKEASQSVVGLRVKAAHVDTPWSVRRTSLPPIPGQKAVFLSEEETKSAPGQGMTCTMEVRDIATLDDKLFVGRRRCGSPTTWWCYHLGL